MSGLCPFALHKIIAPGSSDPQIKPRVAILHVDAGNAFSLEDFFRHRSGGIESHFHVRNDGEIEQYRNIYWQADANHHANDFAVSIETQGFGAGKWNDAQLDAIKRLLVWLNKEAGIPLRKCPAWDSSGVGYHIQFGSPGAWTPVAKSCPGPDRIAQFHTHLVPWMNGNPTKPKPKGLVMDKEVKQAFAKLSAEVADVRAAVGTLRQKEAQRFAKMVREQRAAGRDIDDILAELEGDDASPRS